MVEEGVHTEKEEGKVQGAFLALRINDMKVGHTIE
jgi:hypothetical protein